MQKKSRHEKDIHTLHKNINFCFCDCKRKLIITKVSVTSKDVINLSSHALNKIYQRRLVNLIPEKQLKCSVCAIQNFLTKQLNYGLKK